MITIEQARYAKATLAELYEGQSLTLGITGSRGNFAVSADFETEDQIPKGFPDSIQVQYTVVPVIPKIKGKVKSLKK